MEVSSGLNPKVNPAKLHKEQEENNEGQELQNFELDLVDYVIRSDHHFHSMNALEILREMVRILWYNSVGFTAIAAVLICLVLTMLLSNVLVNQSLVKRLT
ncbi:GATA zinc finger domain-containing, partial [Olea europaea subsp. europaea]